MIIDTSAIVAILRAEPEAEAFARAIAEARSRRVSVVNFVEAAAVIDGSRDPIATRRFDELFREGDLLDAGDFQALPFFQRLHELRAAQQ